MRVGLGSTDKGLSNFLRILISIKRFITQLRSILRIISAQLPRTLPSAAQLILPMLEIFVWLRPHMLQRAEASRIFFSRFRTKLTAGR